MKKLFPIPVMIVLLALGGCAGQTENSETRFLLDTAVTLKAYCNDETLGSVFALCAEYERLLSRTVPDSDISRLNGAEGFIGVSDDTLELLEKSVYYSGLSGGLFDVTICPVSMLWDFNHQVIPDRSEIAAALTRVDYHSIQIKGGKAFLNDAMVDLGGIAKGYIADRLREAFKEKGVTRGIIDLGGNIVVFGRDYQVGIKKPFSEQLAAVMTLRDKSAVTSGIYERYIELDGTIYHHILNPKTGYGVQNEVASVTVIGDNSADCDALSTVCLLTGTEEGLKIINQTPDTEAVFISRDGEITLSEGLYREGEKILFK